MFSEHIYKKPSEREYCKNCTLPAYSKVLDEIKGIVTKYRVADSNLFMSMDIPNVRKIFEIIKQAKEGAQSNTDGNQHQ